MRIYTVTGFILPVFKGYVDLDVITIWLQKGLYSILQSTFNTIFNTTGHIIKANLS